MFLMASCTEAMRTQVKEKLVPGHRFFARVLSTILSICFRPTKTQLDAATKKLMGLKITVPEFPGQSMGLFEAACVPLLHVIYALNRTEDLLVALLGDCITGVSYTTDPALKSKFTDLAVAIDSEDPSVAGLTPAGALSKLTKLWRS